jgi:hypothetical protein
VSDSILDPSVVEWGHSISSRAIGPVGREAGATVSM